MTSIPSQQRGHGSRMLAGLDQSVIINPNSPRHCLEHTDAVSNNPPSHPSRTRQSVNGVQNSPLYDQRIHPMDKVINKRRWDAHLERRGISGSKNDDGDDDDDLVSLYSSGKSDKSQGFGSDPDINTDEDGVQIGHQVDPLASRHSNRLRTQTVPRPNYNSNIHPNDDSISGYRRRTAPPVRKRRKTRRGSDHGSGDSSHSCDSHPEAIALPSSIAVTEESSSDHESNAHEIVEVRSFEDDFEDWDACDSWEACRDLLLNF